MINSGEYLGVPAAALLEVTKDSYITNLNIVASSTLFFWDFLSNLDKEVIYVWKSKLSHIAVLFGAIRFLVTVAEITILLFHVGVWSTTDSTCTAAVWFFGALGLIITTCVDVLLIFRVYALYGRDKALLGSLFVMEAIAFVAVACLIAIALPKTQSVAPRQLPNVICLVVKIPNIESYVWLPMLLVQTTLFLLALGRHIYLETNGLGLFGTTSRIYYTFIRDGVSIFFVMFVCLLLCITGFRVQLILGEIVLYWAYSLMGICASHLIINLRSANDEPESGQWHEGMLSSTGFRFTRFTDDGTELDQMS